MGLFSKSDTIPHGVIYQLGNTDISSITPWGNSQASNILTKVYGT